MDDLFKLAGDWGLVGVPLAVAGFFIWLVKDPVQAVLKARETQLKENELTYKLVGLEDLDELTRSSIVEGLTRREFKRAYGLELTPNQRKALLGLFNEHEPRIGWHHIRNAWPHIQFQGAAVSGIHVSFWGKALYYVTFAVGVFLVLMALGFGLASSLVFVLGELKLALTLLFIGLVYFAGGCTFGMMYVPFSHARRIDEILNKSAATSAKEQNKMKPDSQEVGADKSATKEPNEAEATDHRLSQGS
ncbi:hypothetical protein [Ectothiorhodospira variabilis]|uniref:hypothetical protein n=1 Tax=Ectothiorhodospira variabilis TaxID=505694 RepID=UPI001EFB7EF3|nr:hypothetical protein [Ectothiorhodospira variabilis]MCG5496030.1 hypothetical protein [Ectothiorhodospira variabilis]MCG5505398.1 hypothetical protein [Ectothiorhodospira variabilis]MCG5508584.1 hypothetical protein [Ectothiorhodospira variabilis]